jgi:hypothetical protein
MRLNFTTVLNINYLSKGIALCYSLLDNCSDFHLYIFTVDEISHRILLEKNLSNITILSLHKIENEELLSVKKGRSISEYCWTCKPFIIKHCLETFGLTNCTYVDADLYFYKNPLEMITSMGDNSVLITPHNYYSAYDQSATSGIYCAQLLTFRNTADGNVVLNWWADACIKWCYATFEDGKSGDQKYLDSWPYMFNGVYICKNLNAGVAPWNAINFKSESDVEKIIFYHFHDLQHISDGSWFTGGYDLPQPIINKIYRPYINLLTSISKESGAIDSLNTKERKMFKSLTFKYKVGIYRLDFIAAMKNLIQALFFIKRRRFYKNNFIK